MSWKKKKRQGPKRMGVARMKESRHNVGWGDTRKTEVPPQVLLGYSPQVGLKYPQGEATTGEGKQKTRANKVKLAGGWEGENEKGNAERLSGFSGKQKRKQQGRGK